MEEVKRLSIVIEHWIEHNEAHMGEYRKWAQRAGEMGLDKVKEEIVRAVEILSQSNRHLENALGAAKPRA
jgi:hypothetical protein